MNTIDTLKYFDFTKIENWESNSSSLLNWFLLEILSVSLFFNVQYSFIF